MKLIAEAIGILLAALILVWGIAIYTADPERKPVVTCMPVHFAVTAAGDAYLAVSGVSGGSPRSFEWQDSARLSCLKTTDRWFQIKSESAK